MTTEKRVLITGEGSYIGNSFKDYSERKFSNLKTDTLDMINPAWRGVNFSKYDIVFHVAGLAHADVGNVDDETKAKYYAVNTDLAIEVCEKAKFDGVKMFIFMSSMIIYGDSSPFGTDKIIDINTVPSPANFYGDSKLQADVGVRGLADDNFTVIVLRPPMIYGKGSKGNFALLSKLAKILPVFPDVYNRRSMLHIDNLCELLCQMMLVKEFWNNSIVLIPQNSELVKTSDMVKKIATMYGHNIRLTRLLNVFIKIGSKMPGKVGGLVNKAFGNCSYSYELSTYEGINYQMISLDESIFLTVNTDLNNSNC